jgi:hypothetical protein
VDLTFTVVRAGFTGTEVLVDLTFTVVHAGFSGTEVLEDLTFTVGSCRIHRDRSPGGPDIHPGPTRWKNPAGLDNLPDLLACCSSPGQVAGYRSTLSLDRAWND